ncbi:hypothetical protein GALMADRAFT_144757 [Galerina marginata CBS 339.88]|uniref:Uncharacterized protein n=1 Tax=Galerina marginata (strain CBS 339.88) TaxID=685588 RepID=A0A067SHW7_GALM3|nr:hypothetical protein GALMADRAFT_144757 [Galerina marginata CBS 339.88]
MRKTGASALKACASALKVCAGALKACASMRKNNSGESELDNDSDFDEDVNEGLPNFSCTMSKLGLTYHLHTHAPVDDVVYNLGAEALTGSSYKKSLTQLAASRWKVFTQSKVQSVTLKTAPPLKIRVPGGNSLDRETLKRADTITTVTEDDIVDSLWNDRMERRKIRLGKWTHSWDIPTSEDILADPSSIPYNNAIDTVLTPWEPILKRLLDAPDTVSADEAPAKAWLEGTTKKKKDISKELVPYVGSLSLTVRAQISNWFDVNIGKDRRKQHVWLGRLPIAHAYTVYIATNLKNDPKNSKLTGPELLEKA